MDDRDWDEAANGAVFRNVFSGIARDKIDYIGLKREMPEYNLLRLRRDKILDEPFAEIIKR